MPKLCCQLLLAMLFVPFVPLAFAQSDARVTKDIGLLREEWARDLHGKRLDAAMALYTNDAVFFEPDGHTARGLTEIRPLFASVMKTFNSDIQFQSTSFGQSVGLAYDSGNFQEVLVDTSKGTKSQLRGSYLMVLRREADGKWRIVQHMWTQAAAAAP